MKWINEACNFELVTSRSNSLPELEDVMAWRVAQRSWGVSGLDFRMAVSWASFDAALRILSLLSVMPSLVVVVALLASEFSCLLEMAQWTMSSAACNSMRSSSVEGGGRGGNRWLGLMSMYLRGGGVDSIVVGSGRLLSLLLLLGVFRDSFIVPDVVVVVVVVVVVAENRNFDQFRTLSLSHSLSLS